MSSFMHIIPMKEALSNYIKTFSLSLALVALPLHETLAQSTSFNPLAQTSVIDGAEENKYEYLDSDDIRYWTMVSYNRKEIRDLELIMKDAEMIGKECPFDKRLLWPHIEAVEHELEKVIWLYKKYFDIIDEDLSDNISLDLHRLDYYTKQKELIKKYYDDLIRIYQIKNI